MSNYPIPAVGVIVEKGDEILLIKKGRGLFKGQWCVPGGKIELGETIVETIHREILEETNIYVSNPEFVTYQEFIEKDEDGSIYRHFVFFNFKVKYVKGEPKAGDDAKEFCFFKRGNIQDLDLSEPTVNTFKLMKIIY